MTEVKRDLILPDQHFPLNDPTVWKVYLKVAANIPFNNVITIGDFTDFAAVSTHPRSGPYASLKDECEAANQGLDEITEAGRFGNKEVRFHWLDGNHEFRLASYIANVAPALMGIEGTTIPDLMRLTKRGWSYTPYRGHVKIGDCYIQHDVGKKAGKMAHKNSLEALHVNIIHGHTHRMGLQYEGSVDGPPHYGVMLGWGGSVAAVTSYTDELSARAESVHGFGILYRWTNSRGQPRSRIDPVSVIDGACVAEGRLFEA